MQFLRSLLLAPEEAFFRERVRNDIAHEKLSRERLQRKREEEAATAEKERLDGDLREKREGYAAVAQPLLGEFDDISMAQYYYQEASNIASSHVRIVSQLADRELSEFGYLSKKLISVGLNCEVLRRRIISGEPFERELATVLKDSASDDLALVAEPLRRLQSIPSAAVVRATAFNLAREIEETGRGGQPPVPVRRWLDFLRFRVHFSPAVLEEQRVRARRAAESFRSHIERGDYRKALELAEGVHSEVTRDGGVANVESFDAAFCSFRNNVLPTIASDIFLRYFRSSLNASRYACVEKMLQE